MRQVDDAVQHQDRAPAAGASQMQLRPGHLDDRLAPILARAIAFPLPLRRGQPSATLPPPQPNRLLIAGFQFVSYPRIISQPYQSHSASIPVTGSEFE